MSNDFSPDQKRYLEGFASGLQSARTARGLAPLGGAGGSGNAAPSGPDKEHAEAQAKTLAAGGKLVDQEKWKAAEHPFDAYARFKQQAGSGTYPKPEDNFRWRYHGLFYVAPAQDSYMCRLRIPNGILKAWQFEGVADLAERLGGDYSHVTTRANLQVREIRAENAPLLLEGLADLGLTAKGSGADNIRNVTGSATAGIDPLELLDTRPHARAWHHHILNDRSLYGLPRKFNVAFDGAGSIATLEDTNDIGFQAIEIGEGASFEGQPVEPGIWYRLALGGITGHHDLARDTGIVVAPSDAVAVADAIVRVFIANGNRTNRNKARLKYVLDAWGFDKFLTAVEEMLGRRLIRVDGAFAKPRPVYDRLAHIGVHAQAQAGLNWVGVALPVGKLTVQQMRVIASIANQCGDGDIRLTVWQNLLISGVPDAKVDDVLANLQAIGLSAETSVLRAGLIACTGATGCKFAAAHTKEDALAIAAHCEPRITLDQPVNIHLTGCHHSCAQHYIGDLGLIGAKVPVNEEGDTVPGYDLFVGGGYGVDGGMARPFREKVRAEEAPALVEAILRAWQLHRAAPDESFVTFARRHEIAALQALVAETGSRMTVQTPKPLVQVLPETAPFSEEQRSWLNGFFAGLLSLDNAGVTALSPAENAAVMGEADDGAPWHDPAMAITDRMQLADGKPLPRRLFAAMAQQDCGQCGYVCETYSAAIADGKEGRLNLCAPGGKETLRQLKALMEEGGAAPAAASTETASAAPAGPLGRSRENPALATFLSRRKLNGEGSEKETWHVEFDLSESGLDYIVGDAFGIVAQNDPRLVDAVIALLGARPDADLGGKTLREKLLADCALGPAPDALFQLISYVTGGETRQKAKRLAAGEDPDGDLDRLDVLGTLHKFSSARLSPEAFVEALDPLQPRLYSISSSFNATPGRISLTVDTVRYKVGSRPRWGVASTFLGERVQPGDKVPVYVQRAHGFGLPENPQAPVIMCGPGTGVAPFRAFLHDRKATGAKGRNWLFFGHQRRASDFFYEDELNAMKAEGVLTGLTLAWSRDGKDKIYVQDRMRERGAELFAWLEQGAHFYVCGDAKRMAKDVERAMVDVVAQHGKRSVDEAVAYVAALKKAGRYQADVY